jgi:hypothetical protein
MSESVIGGKNLTRSEFVSPSVRLSPFEDFKVRTIAAISGLWARLAYMIEIRAEDGSYQHWGHSRVHGHEQSQAALARMHSEIYIELLRTPIRELHARESMSDAQKEIGDPQQLWARYGSAIPSELDGGSPKHFSSLLLAARLLDAERASTRLAASQPQPPVR